MARRPVVGNPFDNQIPTTAPVATPVDTYVRGVEKRSSMAGIAETLNRFSRKAAPALQRMEQEAAERDILEGQRLYQENRVAIGEAVKSGLIEEGASPYLRKGYRISQMNTLATRYAEELETNLISQKLYTNGDPERIESYSKKFQEDFVNENGMADFTDSEMAEYFGLSAAKADEAFRSAWRSKHVAWQKEQQYRAFETEVASVVQTLIRPDMTDEEQERAYQNASSWLEKQAQLRNLDGQSNKRVLDSMVSGILFAATQNQDPELLDVLLRTKIGTDVIGNSVGRMKQVYDTKVTIARLQEAQSKRISTELTAEHEALAGEVSAAVFANIHGSNYDPIFVNTQIARLTATKDETLVNEAITLMNYQNATNKLVNSSLFTPELFAQADDMMANQTTRSGAMEAALNFVKQNDLGTQDLDKLINEWEQNYKPSGDEYGLKFMSGSTPEGALISRLKTTAYGSEFAEDYANEEKSDTYRRARKFAQGQIRAFVQKYQTDNDVDEVPEDRLEDFIFTLEGQILTMISADAQSKSQSLVDLTSGTPVPDF